MKALMVKAALSHLKSASTIISTTSVTAYKGSPQLLDYSATKGAIVAFTRSLSQSLIEQGIRVNAIAPGPIWTPLIPSTLPPDKVSRMLRERCANETAWITQRTYPSLCFPSF